MRIVAIAFALVVLTGCKKTFEELRADGYQCIRKGSGGYSVPKDKEHCFVCEDHESMMKCTRNPLSSTCREAKQTECNPPTK